LSSKPAAAAVLSLHCFSASRVRAADGAAAQLASLPSHHPGDNIENKLVDAKINKEGMA
jgi:hypothetical protein